MSCIIISIEQIFTTPIWYPIIRRMMSFIAKTSHSSRSCSKDARYCLSLIVIRNISRPYRLECATFYCYRTDTIERIIHDDIVFETTSATATI